MLHYLSKAQFKNMAKDKFLRFQYQRKSYLQRFTWEGYDPVNATHEDLVLKELLDGVEDLLFYENKETMKIFKRRYNNFIPNYRKIII
jgi:hypothetical protein